jgi:hypothetical protein
MPRKAVPRELRLRIQDRAQGRCEYCQHSDRFACAPFACEHVVPKAAGAGDSFDQLAWACPACNGHKHAKTHGRDPRNGRRTRLFNPRRQAWKRHFRWLEGGLLMQGRTAAGRATVEALRLNRDELANLRLALGGLGEHPLG